MIRIKTNSLGARVISGFLSLLMIVSACPVAVFADDDVDNTSVETTTVIVDENGVHVDGEDDNGYTIVIDDESEDENVDSIPGDEAAQDQNNPDVDTPPKIDDSSDDGTNGDEVIVDDQTNPSEDVKPTEGTGAEQPTEPEETAEPVYEYIVTLPSDKTLSEGDTLDIEATVVAKVTENGETKDVDYTFEFSGEGIDIETKSATSAAITFDKAGEYTIVGKLIVDDEEVASDEMTVKVNPIVVFDHYFTDIDESLVETSSLLVKTSDSSVFTKNTNVVSNFDDVYVIECASVEEARYVYSYYVDKVDSISDFSKVMSIATDKNDEDVADLDNLNDGNDAIAQLNDAVEDIENIDYSDYIALIDTGADDADVKFSVVGDDVNDYNGHGSKMLDLIKNENPDAKIMSIKVFNGSTTDAASVYAGIKLAIENDVKIINLSLVGADVEKNAIVKEAIQEAIDKDIVVIGAAGNYNLSATKFIPGCIDKVITIGAANSDGTKKSNSNYDVDYYVVADSTSEAAAIFAGLYSSNITEDSRLYDGDLNPTETVEPVEPIEPTDENRNYFAEGLSEALGTSYIINPDGTATVIVPVEELFEIAAEKRTTDIDGPTSVRFELDTTGSWIGTCSFSGSSGEGTAYNFTAGSSGNSNLFYRIWTDLGSPGIYASCDRYWGDTTDSKNAVVMTNGTVNYKATVDKVEPIENGAKLQITFDILYSDNDNFNNVVWTPHTTRWDWTTSRRPLIEIRTGVDTNGDGFADYWGTPGTTNPGINVTFPNENTTGAWQRATCYVDWSLTKAIDGVVVDTDSGFTSNTIEMRYQINQWNAAIHAVETNAVSAASAAARSGVTVQGEFNGYRADDISVHYTANYATQNWSQANRHQLYRSAATAWEWNHDVYVELEKTVSGESSLKFDDSYNFSDNTRLELFLADGITPVYDKDGNAVVWEPDSPGISPKFTLDYATYHDTAMVLKETSVGFGYAYGDPINLTDGPNTDTKTTGGGESTTTFTLDNKPMEDPIYIRVQKTSNNSGTGKPSGDINVNGAVYTLTGYAVNTNCEKTGSALWSQEYTTETVAGLDGIIDLRAAGELPIGYYELKETKAPEGMKISNTVYSIYVLPSGCTPGNSNNDAYHTSNNISTFMYEGSGHNGTWIYQLISTNTADGTPQVNTAYRSVGNIATITLVDSNDLVRQLDEEIWRPMGLFKADSDFDNLGMTSNGILRIPEGDGSYQGAQYQLFCTTNRADFFQYTYNNPNGSGNNLTFGAGANSVSTVDGFGVAGTTPFNTTLYPIQYNGQNAIITTDANGFAQTAMSFPYSDDYVWVEIKAPVGYRINTHLYTVSANDWYEDDENHTTFKTLDTYTANAVNIVKITEEGHRDGAAIDAIYRYGFALYKKDLTNSNDALNNPQGDANLNGIRFAVINRSSQHIVMRNQYTNQMPNANDRNNTVIVDGREILPNQICAVVTTHNDTSNREGYIALYGLPYGKYEIVELRRDAANSANLIGQTYSNGMGSSTYANNSYLWDSTNVFAVDYTTSENREYHDVGNISHFTWNYAAQSPDHIARNKVFIDGFQSYKMDEDYLEVTEGNSNANGIKFAVINRSAHSVEILQSDIDKLAQVDPNWASYVDFIPGGTNANGRNGTGDSSARIANGYVVAVLTTHDSPTTTAVFDGYFAIYGLPYGTYEVVELRRDADVQAGDNWNSATKGTSIYANDSFYWKNYSYTYSLTDTDDSGAHNDVISALTKHNSPYGVVSDNQYQNEVFRDGFSFWKKDSVYHDIDSHPQGDATFNDIRYAIVNTSDDNIKLFNKYTQLLPASDQPYISIVDNEVIAPGQVCAIVTSHNKGGTDELSNGDMQGYVAMFGLPYGTYEIHELRRDATIAIGDVYEGSNKLGTSIYANYDTNVHPSMLWEDHVFVYTLEDTEDGVHGTLYDVSNIHQTDDNEKDIWTNETAYGSIWIHKYDRETGKQANQGTNSLAGIQFAVVNRSQWSVSYPYNPDDPNPENYEPGEVIAVVETDEEGNVHLDYMCYGSYDVYELRINNSYCGDNSYSYGNTVAPHDIFDVNAYRTSDTSTDLAVVMKYGNDERANLWYCWNESIENVRVSNEALHEVEVDYTVSPQEGEIRVQDQENQYDYYDLPVRGDFYMIKVNQDGKIMPYVPFLLSHVETDENGVPLQNPDGSYVVIEEHVIVTDFDGEIDTRNWSKRPKTAGTVNQLDAYYNGIDFTGNKDQLKAAANQNVWFGSQGEYVDYDGTHVINSRGSLLAGTYVLQELRRSESNGFMGDDIEQVLMDNGQYRYIYWNTEDYDMLSNVIHVVHDNKVIYGEDWDIGVDIPLYIKSDAIDTNSNTKSTLPGEYGALADTAEFGNLNATQRYGYKTYIYRVEEDGTQHLLDETDITVLDFTGPKYFDQSTNKAYAQIKNADGTYTVVKNGCTLVLDSDGIFHMEGAPSEDSTVVEPDVIHDFKVMQNFSVDTSSCQEGESICFRIDLYKAAGASGWNLLKTHNNTLTEPTQKVGIIKLTTESTDKTTNTRVASLGGYAYGEDGMPLVNNAATTGNLVYNTNGEIVGYTLVDDKIVYKNLVHDHNYRFHAYLVDANGTPVYDIYGNECRIDLLALYIDKDLDHVLNGADIVAGGGSTIILQKSLEGPCDGEITFSEFGMMDWILPNNPNGTNSVFIKVDLYDARGTLLKSHNANMDEEDETLRWLQIETTAMSEDGDQGILPNGRSWDLNGNMIKDDVVLRDVIHYSNLAEPINARVEGYVYLVGYNADGTRYIDTNNGLDTPYVAYETKNFSLTGTEGDVEMSYTIKDSGQYAKRDLVVYERVYMDVDGHADGTTEVLIALHEDINDAMQTVSIITPEIHTEFLESHTETHVVPLEEDATVTDYVHYSSLVPGKSYIMQCVLMDKTSNKPLKDEDGNMFAKDVTFEASATGEGDVEIEFTISAELLHTFDTDLGTDHLDLDQNVQAVGKYTGTAAREEHGITDDDVKNVQHGTQIVAFERCIDADQPTRVIAKHADINDEKQTILIPRIFTHLTDTVIGDHVTSWNTTATITDTVTFVSLQADKEYEISGYLVNAETGEPVLDKDGNKITATNIFTPNQLPADQVSITESEDKLIASGKVDLVFTFDSTYLKGTHVVAFEDCYYNGIKVATHADINDQWQWTFVPEISTTADGYATDKDGKEIYREKVVPYGETVNIIDAVEYNKLLPGVWYEMSGTLMDKATGKALVDKDGKAITATTRFLPAETSGTVEVVFTLDTTGLENTSIVAFEECLYVGAKKDGTPNEEAVAKHEDINDVEQTVYVPKIRTTVTDADGNTNVKLDGTNTNATLIDTVSYENLVPGKIYTVTGKLVYKKDYAEGAEYEYVKDANGNVITASATVNPSAENSTINEDGLASGSVDVKFVFDASLIAGKTVVVFEDMYLENVRVATHSDITDENQTFETGMKLHVKLVKSDFDDHEYVLKNAEISIYVDEECTQLAKDINGNDCVGTTNENGEVEFTILTYDENQIFYAKETKAPFGYTLCDTVIPIKGTAYYTSTLDKTDYTETDASKDSAGVCIINLKMFDKIIIIPPKTGDNLPILPIAIIALLGILCIGAFFATKKKKVTVDNDAPTNVDEIDEEEVEDSVIGLMTEDIDGNAHNGYGF